MGKKVFVSYSHKDESHREDFEDHLVMLRRRGVIDVWHDRKILPGAEWKGEIDDNLEEADIVIFLVSPSFLASDYCYDVELKRALEKKDEGTAEIISILVRPCDWMGGGFAKYQALPKDAVPITTWDDPDSAWLNVVDGLKRHIDEFSERNINLTPKDEEKGVCLSDSFRAWTEDTEITLAHRKVDKIKLSDIFVMPDMELDNDKDAEIVTIRNISTVVSNPGKYVLSGEEQQGKTSILKRLFAEYFESEFLPVYLDSLLISKSDVDFVVSKALSEQYCGLSYEDFCDSDRAIILIDNVDEIKLNKKYSNIFFESLNRKFSYAVLTCHSSYSYVIGEVDSLHDHVYGEILALGNKKREELVQNWISLGVEECIDEFSLYSECDDLKARLDTVVKKNIVPARPIYILMLLQMFEANSRLSLDLTSYGHCYQQLIYQAFDKAGIRKQDFDKYINILTELAWEIHLKDGGLDEEQTKSFTQSYAERFLSVDFSTAFGKLISNSILDRKDSLLTFKYPYIYYFFAGKKIAESYSSSEEIKAEVKVLLDNLHREDFANILIFITHHTKDSWVLHEIQNVLHGLFDSYSVASLEKSQLEFMSDFMKKIPELVLEQREVQEERDRHNEELDRMERQNEPELDEAPDFLSNINKAFKGMEIAGQVIRNRHATLTRDSLADLAECGVNSGLRFLKHFIEISDSAKNEIVRLISSQLKEFPNLSDREIERQAENTYLHLTYGVINSVVRKIASSVGSKEALEIYLSLERSKNTPAYTLIRQSIELQFNKRLDVDSLSSSVRFLRDNPVSIRILKEMVVQHIYMFPVDYKEKQKLSSLLGISVQGQRYLDRQKLGKG